MKQRKQALLAFLVRCSCSGFAVRLSRQSPLATVLESLYLTSDSFDPYGINVEHFRLNGAPTELDVAYEILRDGMYSMHALSIEEAHD